MFDIHSRMAYAKKLQHDSGARLDRLDTTLNATALDTSALCPHPRQCARCKSIWSRTVYFPSRTRWRRLRRKNTFGIGPRNTRTPHESTLAGTPLRARKDATSSNEKPVTKGPNANEHTFAKIVGGTTLRPIAQSLPQIKSPFPIDTWCYTLRNHPASDLLNDLLNDIEFGVRIGFRTSLISSNHFSAISNPASVAKELERQLPLNRKAGPFLVPPFSNFVGSPMGAIPKKHSQPLEWRIINDIS